jgi:plastocyanin
MSRIRFRAPKQLLWALVLLPALMIGLQHQQPIIGGLRIVDVTANVPEAGGFQPASIRVEAGDKVMLRFHAQDVAHGVAIGPGLDVDLGDIPANTTRSVLLTFEEAGTFTFYCNLFCSPNHWRMRGIIDVVDRHTAPYQAPGVGHDPTIDALIAEGIDIDAVSSDPAHSPDHTSAPAGQDALHPSPARGAAMADKTNVPGELKEQAWRRTHTPNQGLAALSTDNPATDAKDLADLTAFLWMSGESASERRLQQAATLYAKNCASCHGKTGAGDGQAAGLGPQPPASFVDAQRMFDRRSDVLYAKIQRGGMGTGMPNFGTIFTSEETWSLVDYLWRLAFGDAKIKH